MKASKGKIQFIEMAVFAFASFVCWVTNSDSAWADKHHAHWIYTVGGIVTGLCAVGKLIQIMTTQSTPPAR